MLRVIRICNLALIRDLEMDFGPGLNLLTGETGSGKSILVDALGLLLGARSSQEMIRLDSDAATIEGIFELERIGSVQKILAESGLESEEDTLLIRREISAAGRNRIFINNHIATLSILRSVGDKLADIHGQQDQRSLLDLSTHLEWLDHFGNNHALVEKVQESYRKLRRTAQQLESLESSEQERLRRIDILQYQIDEIRKVDPRPDEKEDLENERSVLANREKILALATEAYGLLYESESSVLIQTNRLERILEELERFDKSWAPHRESLQECRYKLEDLSYTVRDYADGSDFSPERLEQVHQRLYALEKLAQKYGESNRDILEFLDQSTRELDRIRSYAESSGRLVQQLELESDIYKELAEKLSQKRQRDAERLEKEIEKEFKALAMERMQLRVHFRPAEKDIDKSRIPGFYGLRGIDHVEFLISPNKGEDMRPLAKIASGGELSRLMLAIRSLCRNNEADKTFVFDEVDAGIGGRVAEAVGRRLCAIAEDNQVLCVTHLPQIAAFAHSHFSVRKDVIGDRTETIAKQLDESERIQELSRMLGGETITQTVRNHAREMLEYSMGSGKKEQQSQVMAKRYFIETFGCQMNDLDSEKIAGSFRHKGMERTNDVAQADVIVLNTCSVREKAVQKVYARLGEIRRYKDARSNLIVSVVGCMPQIEGEKILKKAPYLSLLAGPQKGHIIGDLVERSAGAEKPVIELRRDEDPSPLDTVHIARDNPWRANVTISEGCSRRCSYCVVPAARGKERARSSESIIREIGELAASGYIEIMLLGQTVNSYRDRASQINFAQLLRRISEIPGLKRIRFTSPHPGDFTDELLDVMIRCPQICNHIHLPVQSGSTRVLSKMRRGYTRECYLEIVRKIREAPRSIAISTDIIAGFPGESESDFQDTLSLLDEAQYDSVFSFKYSPRPNTEALNFADEEIPEEEKGRRLAIIQEKQKIIQYKRNALFLGRKVEVLVEGKAKSRVRLTGRTSENKIVNFDGSENLIGRFAAVEISGVGINSLKGVWIQP